MKANPEPKRRNPVATRARILAAAFDLFASRGYARTGMREIAQEAGVAVSLVVKYFGTKAALFEEALVDALYTHGMFVWEKQGFGEKMARMIVEAQDSRIPAIMVLAIADPESQDIAKRITHRVVTESLAEWLGPPRARGRAFEMLVLFNGFTIQAHHLLTGELAPASVDWLARSLQAIVDEGLPEAESP